MKNDAGAYRYGFNGKENDRDWGTKWIQDYGFRLYNPAIARFLSVDPLTTSYPWFTPYQFAGNIPIYAIDLDGLESKERITGTGNVVIVMVLRDERKVQLEAMRSSTSNVNWDYFEAATIKDANRRAQEYLSKFRLEKFGNLVLETHGLTFLLKNGDVEHGVVLNSIFPSYSDGGSILAKDIKRFVSGKDPESYEGRDKVALQNVFYLNSLINKVDKEGTFCFSSCNLGMGDEIAFELGKIRSEGDLYLSLDKSLIRRKDVKPAQYFDRSRSGRRQANLGILNTKDLIPLPMSWRLNGTGDNPFELIPYVDFFKSYNDGKRTYSFLKWYLLKDKSETFADPEDEEFFNEYIKPNLKDKKED